MENTLALALSHATEVGAIAASRMAGFGDKKKADHEAVEAIRGYLNQVEFNGRIVIGEGERDEAPMLYIGEKVGTGKGQMVDIAVDPLENTNATASFSNGAIVVLAASEKGGLFHAPDMYMDKLIVPEQAKDYVDIDAPPQKNLQAIAKGLERDIRDLVVVILDRERNEELISKVREAGARVQLIADGDLIPGVAGCMRGSGIHAVMGIGAAPETVITAAALRCLKGGLQARFWPKNEEEKIRLKQMGARVDKVYTQDDLASGKTVLFCATGVTDGSILKGVRFFGAGARTQTLVTSTQSKKIRFIDTTHVLDHDAIKFRL
ncbi:MAG: fructose-1,6-bisphosphatase [Patescibacteria group bacterium]|nr:MAG: fructose-1,6-bisphosphatase [Patescibacteria group bacterium]